MSRKMRIPTRVIFFFLIFATISLHAVDPGRPHGVISDGTTGTLVSGLVNYTVSGGVINGGNLFHSFASFNIHSGESVMFTSSGITNLIIRVTGTDYSWLNGQITSSATRIYIMNSEGENLGNSFIFSGANGCHLTSAHYIRLGAGTDRFYSDLASASSLSAAAPGAFGFLSTSTGPIVLDGCDPLSTLVPVSVIGGNIALQNNAVLDNHGGGTGRIDLASVASAGEVVPTATGLDVSSFSAFGMITVEAGSELKTEKLFTAGDVTVGGNWNVIATEFEAMSPSTVTFSGVASQNIHGTNRFDNLILSNPNGLQLNSEVVVKGVLTFSQGLFILGSGNLTLGLSATIAGSPSATAMVVATSSGEMRKKFSGPGSFLFPVGDADGTAEYSPVSVDFSSGSFGAGSYVGVKVKDDKHPNNGYPGDHLTRYWIINENAITGFSSDATCHYVDADITGVEANIRGAKYDLGSWTALDLVNIAANTLSGTVTSFGDFSGVHQSVPVELMSFSVE